MRPTPATKRLRRLTGKRNRKIQHLLPIASRRVIDHLVDCGIGTLVIGYNPNWKQQVNLGRVNHQKFVSIPHQKLVEMLSYTIPVSRDKAQLAGIQVREQDESYTSKCSFLDGERPQKREQYARRRIARGLYRTAEGILSNADVNAAYNIIPLWDIIPLRDIITKAFPNSFEGIEGVVPGHDTVHPVRAMLSQTE